MSRVYEELGAERTTRRTRGTRASGAHGYDPRMDRLERIHRIEIISDEQAAILRRIPGARRVAMMDALCDFGRELMFARLRATHPTWTDEQRATEVARRVARASE